MPLYLPGSIQIGPRAGGSGPATLPDYLASIGKDSWYGGFKAPYQLFSDIANTVPVTTDGAAWRNWLANWSAGGFSASFGQSTGSRRCALGLSRNGKPGVYGDGVDWYANLSSTTEINRSHTVLISAWATFGANNQIYSHNHLNMHFKVPVSSNSEPTLYAASGYGSLIEKVVETTPVNGTTAAFRVGWSSVGSAFYNNAPNIFRNSLGSGYTDSTIYELWYVPRLTPAEIIAALKYLA